MSRQVADSLQIVQIGRTPASALACPQQLDQRLLLRRELDLGFAAAIARCFGRWIGVVVSDDFPQIFAQRRIRHTEFGFAALVVVRGTIEHGVAEARGDLPAAVAFALLFSAPQGESFR